MDKQRRQWLRALAAAAAVGVSPARAGLFDPDVSDIEVGSSGSGTLDVKTSRRLSVQSTMRTREVRWIDQHGRVVDRSSTTEVDNKYNWQTTVRRSTEIWQITSEDLKAPEPVVLRVRSRGVALFVTVFSGVESAGKLDPERGLEVMPAEPGGSEWLALFTFDPSVKQFITVQGEESERVPYRIAVLRASRFRR